jgi:hypothetical protein
MAGVDLELIHPIGIVLGGVTDYVDTPLGAGLGAGKTAST